MTFDRERRTEATRTEQRERRQRTKNATSGQRERPVRLLHRTLGNQAVRDRVESETGRPRLTVDRPGDRAEREADRVSERVVSESARRDAVGGRGGAPSDGGRDNSAPDPSGTAGEERSLWRDGSVRSGGTTNEVRVDESVAGALRSVSGGRPLPPATRAFFERRFGRDFGDVRVHTGDAADRAARSVAARAFATGRDLVFRSDAFRPGTEDGKRLVAHELAHVVQQRDRGGAIEGRTIQRAPERETETGPVSGRGGLIHDASRKRMSVVVGPGDTLRSIAAQLLPYWNEAEPFTPPGASAPTPKTTLTAEELAKGLLVYNRYYLGVPDMTRWQVGLRLPLPIEVNRETGDRIVNAATVKRWVERFESEWEPLLDQNPRQPETQSAEERRESVESFLKATPTPAGRGIRLGARAMRNAEAAAPFVTAVFDRLGSDAFETALAFVDNLVNHQIQSLASQRPGRQIVDAVRRALARTPAELSSEQQRSLARANRMLSRLGVFETESATAFEQIYVTDVPGSNCMTAVYKGLEGLYGEDVSKSIRAEVSRESRAVMERTGRDTNNMDRIVQTVRERGKAGPEIRLRYDRRGDTWVPDPEQTILDATDSVAGWYFFGLSLHGAYHSVVLAVDKSTPSAPKIYWMDQFSKGFENEVTGSLTDAMKRFRPPYGYAPSKVWQLLPAADTLIELR